MKSIYKGNRVTCSDHGWSTLSSCADFVGTFEDCRAECTERPNVSQNSNMRKASGDWGGISFQCAETPFTSATGEVKTPLGGGADRAIGGGKKNYTCKCIQADGSLTLATISAWSSRAAKRQCSRSGRSCFLESSWGT